MLNARHAPPDHRHAALARYVTDCDHEGDCRCKQDKSLTWRLEQRVAVNMAVMDLHS